MKRTLLAVSLLSSATLAAACGGDDDADSLYGGTQGDGDGDGDGAGDGDGDGDGSGDGDGDGDGDGSGDGDGDGDGGPLLDVSVGDGDGDGDGDCQEGQEDCYCSSVDILFVVDNSVSMNDYQTALGLAFPDFADSMVAALPNGVDVHVGVTSTTMGYSSAGMTQNCVATGDGDQPQEAFYDTPDQGDNGLNGAQGRLFDPGGGLPLYFSADTDDAASMQELAAWFTEAVAVGTGGSQIEMATAPAGWVADPANDATNAGFVRDEGAVLVVFFLQDEPDQTPVTIDGQPGGLAMLDRLADAKAGCGGTNCIVGGGLVNQYCYDDTPISDFLGGLAQAPVVAALPDENLAEDDPAAAADEMNTYLSDTLALVIGEACENIPPEG